MSFGRLHMVLFLHINIHTSLPLEYSTNHTLFILIRFPQPRTIFAKNPNVNTGTRLLVHFFFWYIFPSDQFCYPHKLFQLLMYVTLQWYMKDDAKINIKYDHTCCKYKFNLIKHPNTIVRISNCSNISLYSIFTNINNNILKYKMLTKGFGATK